MNSAAQKALLTFFAVLEIVFLDWCANIYAPITLWRSRDGAGWLSCIHSYLRSKQPLLRLSALNGRGRKDSVLEVRGNLIEAHALRALNLYR